MKAWYKRKTVWAAVSAIAIALADITGLTAGDTEQLLVIVGAVGVIFMRSAIETNNNGE